MIRMIVESTTWDGKSVVDSLTGATADGRDAPGASGQVDAYTIPDGAKEVKIQIIPVKDEWWGTTVTLAVAADGTLKVTDRADAFAVDVQVLQKGTVGVAKVFIRLLKVKLATKLFIAALRDATPQTATPPGTDRATANAIADSNLERRMIVTSLVGTSTPITGDTLTLPQPASFARIDAGKPVSGGVLKLRTSPPVVLKNTTFVVEVAGQNGVAPRTIAVSWPDAVSAGAPAPMFVFFRHAPLQERNYVYGKFRPEMKAYPYTFDYAYFGLMENLWFQLMPDFYPSSRGLPYQIAAAGKNVVTVVACPTATPAGRTTQFGNWTRAEFMQSILLEIQALFAAMKTTVEPTTPNVKAPATLGRVAIGAFSSGNYYLSLLLKNEGKPDHPFLTGTVQECYFFDPDNDMLQKHCLPPMLAWQSTSTGGKAIIRLYNRRSMPEQKPLLGRVVTTTPHFTDSTDKRTTVSAVTEGDWNRAIAALHGKASPRPWRWLDAHFASSAFMLTHAMFRSGF